MQDAEWEELSRGQSGVVSRQQLLELGYGRGRIAHRVRSGSWRHLHPGVYATHAGPRDFTARVWAVLLHAGPHAVISHQTAAYLQGLVDAEPQVIDIAVPWRRHLPRTRGITLHRCRRLAERRHPAASVPQTRIEDTVLDLTQTEDRADDIVGWITRGCQRRLTTPDRLSAAVSKRSRLRSRSLILEVLADVRDGVASPLERRYARDVERAHGLPRSLRNRLHNVRGRRRYSDVRYAEYRVRVELEGLAYHPDDASDRDAARDNAAVVAGDAVLTYGWHPVTRARCEVALEMGAVLQERGWPGQLVRCSSTCLVMAASGQSNV